MDNDKEAVSSGHNSIDTDTYVTSETVASRTEGLHRFKPYSVQQRTCSRHKLTSMSDMLSRKGFLHSPVGSHLVY